MAANRNIGNLPRKGAKYWTDVDAQVEIHEPKHRRCSHEFAHITANELECKKCHIGFYITDEELKNGHIYKKGKFLI
jgi:hypothetical protein